MFWYRGPFYLVSLPFRRSAFKGGGASSILANPVSTSSGTSPVSLFISERNNWELIHYFHEYIRVTNHIQQHVMSFISHVLFLKTFDLDLCMFPFIVYIKGDI